ncbi:hypothetical protein HELRODRAFT_182730 [Helobdella robusta]|uniref:Uncharacterized protein n=1 Tax=Helobdella robusta TaxID=6412 RepID=T1FIN5_HELRO|nr:hypothetical protein HELRODRAFT_182730 [Helobdella robusta]ESN90230.1 hypothetical protein HELRODRAFT_182730 [Helobdella robusta]
MADNDSNLTKQGAPPDYSMGSPITPISVKSFCKPKMRQQQKPNGSISGNARAHVQELSFVITSENLAPTGNGCRVFRVSVLQTTSSGRSTKYKQTMQMDTNPPSTHLTEFLPMEQYLPALLLQILHLVLASSPTLVHPNGQTLLRNHCRSFSRPEQGPTSSENLFFIFGRECNRANLSSFGRKMPQAKALVTFG